MNTVTHDTAVLRDLAGRYAEVAADDVQDRRRRQWRDLNSLVPVAPPIYVRGGECWGEVPEINQRRCRDDFLAGLEGQIRLRLYWAGLSDDSVFEPWLRIGAAHRTGGWGLQPHRTAPAEPGGAWKHAPPIRQPQDIRKLVMPRHDIDEAATAERAASTAAART